MSSNENIVIHNVELSKTGTGLSGGETCLIEVTKYLAKIYKNVVYVPDNGKIVYTNNGLEAEYKVIPSYFIEKRFGVIISYLWRIILSTLKIPEFDRSKKNIIISHSDFLPTVWYAWLMKLKNPDAKWFAFCHMLAPNPFKGYEGEFTGKVRAFPSINLVLYQVSQKFFFFLVGLKADKAIFVNPHYESYLNKSRLKGKYMIIKLGTDAERYIHKITQPEKIYDGIFIGRFHPQKGIFDLIDICRRVADTRPNFRLAIIGSGSEHFQNRLNNEIRTKGLDTNINLMGYKQGIEKYNAILQSRILLFPSYYESFGIVAIEAMRCGLPVVAYDLPVFEGIFSSGMIKIPILDNNKFAETVSSLLDDQEYYRLMSKDALRYSKDLTWENTGNQIHQVILNACENRK